MKEGENENEEEDESDGIEKDGGAFNEREDIVAEKCIVKVEGESERIKRVCTNGR